MILSKALILKGLAGVTTLGGAVTIGVVGKERGWWGGSIDPVLKELIEKVGLSCNLDNICTQVSGQTTNIKKESNLDDKTLTTTGTSGKIKVYKLSGESTGYKDNFKFVIEEGDISINGDGTNKLEQFETYEIKEEGADSSKKWYFSRKTEAKDEIKRLLGITEENCTLGANTNCSEIEVDTTKFSSMKFDGVTSGTPTSSAAIKLKVTKVTPTDPDYPLDYKFELKGKDSTANLTLGSKTITLKQNETTEFKIKVTPSSGATPVELSLEKAWTAKTLGAKVGLVCEESNSEKTCSFTDGKINVKNDSDKIEGAKVKEGSTGKKMTYEEDQANYNQGIKFYTEEDITLTCNGTGGNTSVDKTINKKSGDSGIYYEIKKDSDSKWYLTKKTTTGGSS